MDGEGNDGLMQRFQLAVYPDISPDWQNVDRKPNAEYRKQAFEAIHRICKASPEALGAMPYRDSKTFWYVRFQPEAQELFTEWRTKLEHELRRPDLPEHTRQHLSKYRSLIPSLALLIHFADGGHGNVTHEALQKALKWDVYLRSHSIRIYNMAERQNNESPKSLLQKIKAGKLNSPFTEREVYRHGWSDLKTPKQVQNAVDVLEAHNMLERVQQATTGRDKTLIHIHPDLTAN